MLMQATLGVGLYHKLNNLFQEDPNIDEVGLILGNEDLADNPEKIPGIENIHEAFFLEEHKLGIAVWAVIPLYREALKKLKVQCKRLKEENKQMGLLQKSDLDREIVHTTRAILLINGDCYTAWNRRKELVQQKVLSEKDEILFNNLVCTKHPKSIDTWAYRKWLSIRILSKFENIRDLQDYFIGDLNTCTLLCDRKPRNYHAWSHRSWIFPKLPLPMAIQELKENEAWSSKNVADYSSWSYRFHIIGVLRTKYHIEMNICHCSEMFHHEMELIKRLLKAYPEQEALWMYRRSLMTFVFDSLPCCGAKIIPRNVYEATPNKVEQIKLSSIGSNNIKYLFDEFNSITALLSTGSLNRKHQTFCYRHVMWLLEKLDFKVGTIMADLWELLQECNPMALQTTFAYTPKS